MVCKWHETPLNAVLHVIAFFILLYGLWLHNWTYIIAAIVIAVIGHIIQCCILKGKKEAKTEKSKKRR